MKPDKKALRRLKSLRNQIDAVDRAMMKALAKRFRVVVEVGRLKMRYDIPVVQKSRMNEMLNGRKRDSVRLKLDPKMIYEIFDLIHDASIEAQEKLRPQKRTSKKRASRVKNRSSKKKTRR